MRSVVEKQVWQRYRHNNQEYHSSRNRICKGLTLAFPMERPLYRLGLRVYSLEMSSRRKNAASSSQIRLARQCHPLSSTHHKCVASTRVHAWGWGSICVDT